MAIFYPRKTRYQSGNISGDIVDLDWYKYVYGSVVHTYPLPNCTVYAYGRTLEQFLQQGFDISIRTDSYNPFWWNPAGSHYGNAETWFEASSNWSKGTEPKIGAIACWDGDIQGLGGHVAIVEAINEDNTIDISESSFGSYIFKYATIPSPVVGQITSHVGERFQGYIYIPIDYKKRTPIIYRRGNRIKIIDYGRASSFGDLPIARGIGWKRDVLRVFKERPFPIQVGDIKTGITTGFYKPEALELINY